MPQAIPIIIAAAVKIGTAIVVAYKASLIVRIAIHIAAILAITFVSKALASKPGKINQGQELSLKLDPTMPRQVVVGRAATGGSQAWGFTYGQNGDIPNRYLVRVIALSDRPITGVVKVIEGDQTLTFSGDPTAGLVNCNQHLGKRGEARFSLQIVKGSDSPTGSEASWMFAASNGAWTTSHKYTGGAYAIMRCDYDADAFPNGEPQLVFVLDGATAYNDRENSHNLADPSTWAFTRNSANIALQLLRGYRTNGSLIIGSQAIESDFIPADNIAAMNTCDQDVTITGGGTVKRYQAGMLLTASESTTSMLTDLRNSMDGDIYDRNGKICLLPGATRTPVFSLDDTDIDWTAERSYQPIASLSSLYNQVVGTYVPEDLNFVEDSFPIKKDANYADQDGGEKITLSQSYRAVNSGNQIQRITTRVLYASRFQKVVAFTGPLWLYEAQQGDWFTLTSARWDMSEKYFCARLVTLNQDLSVTIVALETSTTIDGWAAADEVPRTSTDYVVGTYNLGVPTVTLTAFIIQSASPHVPPTGDITTIDWTLVTDPSTVNQTRLPGIKIEVTPLLGSPSTAYNLQIRRADTPLDIENLPNITRGATYLEVVDNDVPNDADVVSSFSQVQRNILPGTQYQIRARASDGDRHSTWSSWSTVTTLGTYVVPDAGGVGGRPYTEVFRWLGATAAEARTALEEVTAIGVALGEDFADRIAEILAGIDDSELFGEAVLRLAREQTDLQAWLNRHGYVAGVPVGTTILQEITNRITGDQTIVTSVDLVTIRVGNSEAAIITETSARVTAVAAEASARTILAARVTTSEAAILTEQNVRASADSAEASARTTLAARVTTSEAAIVTESSVRATAIAAEAASRTALAVRVTDSEAAIVIESSARATAISAEASARTTLAARVTTAEAAIVTEQNVRADADSTFAGNFTLLGARRGNATGWVLNESSVDISSRGTFASVLNGLTTTDTNLSASVITETNARISGDGILSSQVTTVTTTANGNTASITSLITTTDGLSARAAVVINANGRLTGWDVNGSTSTFIIAAENFAIASAAGGAAYYPMAISGGKIRFTGDVEVDGNLAVTGSFQTGSLAANATTLEADAFTAGSITIETSNTLLQGVTLTTTGGRVVINANFFLDFWHPQGGGGNVTIFISRAGSFLFLDTFAAIGGDYLFGWQNITVVDYPGAGTHVWEVYALTDVGNATNRYAKARFMQVTEYKK